MLISGIFCPLSLTLFHPHPLLLPGSHIKKVVPLKKSGFVKLQIFSVKYTYVRDATFPPRFCFQNLKCTIRGCTISWRVVGYGLIFLGGGYWCEKHLGQKENHYFTRLEIMVVTRVYCEKLLKLFDFSGRVV